ncbi:hypothetical protein SDC9_160531 [bioreactor metagenome]|uniref:Ferric oxidoreductase domain-containing protein n=1 Tax=bioreactor metagenome TaxID=1076179 RepID=A0A645FFS0_9ZZZZ
MELLLNLGLAKISLVLSILLSIIYSLRILNKKLYNNKNKILNTINKLLRKHHKKMGISLVFTGLIHGIYSSKTILSFNLGTITWVVSVILGLNFMLRKKLPNYKPWIYYHRILTLIFLVLMLMHILVVKT